MKNREALPRSGDRKTIDLILRLSKKKRQDQNMYRQQELQRKVRDTTGGNDDEYDVSEDVDLYESAAIFKERVEAESWMNATKHKVSAIKSNYSAETKDGITATFTPYETTTYKKQGRLRVPSGTKKEIYISVKINNPNGTTSYYTKTFGTVRGEYSANDEKIQKAKEKVIAWFKKHLDVTITTMDFHY